MSQKIVHMLLLILLIVSYSELLSISRINCINTRDPSLTITSSVTEDL